MGRSGRPGTGDGVGGTGRPGTGDGVGGTGRPGTGHRATVAEGRRRRLAAVALGASLLGSLLAACGSAPSGPTTDPTDATGGGPQIELTVLAAASLGDVTRELAARYETRVPGVRIRLSFDSTSALRAKVESGLAADVLAAADETTPARLVAAELARGTPLPFAATSLALVVPADADGAVRTVADLARPGVRIVAASPDVPISRYVERLLPLLAGVSGAPADLPARYAANVVSREDNVRTVLAKLELGEGDAGFVYATDAAGSPRVRSIPLPPAAETVRATYVAVALAASEHPEAAAAFLAWLDGAEARGILAGRGFEAIP